MATVGKTLATRLVMAALSESETIRLKEWAAADEQKHGPYARAGECPYVLHDDNTFMKCVRPQAGHRCGGAPFNKNDARWHQANAPFFVVIASWSRMVIPDQQLSLLDEPRLEWDNTAAFFSRQSRNRSWWVEVYFCKHGRDFSISQSKDGKARRIDVKKIRHKPGCKVKTISEDYMICT